MLLTDQVDLLRVNLAQLRDQQLALPLMGGFEATRQTYQFKSLVHPARDIATMIARVDPDGNRLPARLRGWNLSITDEFGNARLIHLKKLLGMIVHVYYLRIGDDNLDVSNDEGKRVIVPYMTFLDSVKRLVLAPEDICLVACGLTERALERRNAIDASIAMTPNTGNMTYDLLPRIKRWPELQERIWTTFFAPHSTPVEVDCQTVNNQPFLMGATHTGTMAYWRIGWRRDDVHAQPWIEIPGLIEIIQEYFTE